MNPLHGKQTIFALSSGKLPSGVAVIRLSGPGASAAVLTLAGALPEPRIATLKNLKASDGRYLDAALVLWFPAPASFTGEDCAEFQCHGGLAVVAALLNELSNIEGCRLADAGEFSFRAFTNGKADLTQMEALADLIDAETESQRALAIAGAKGVQKTLYESWRQELLMARAFLEADLDFSDEEDVPGSVASRANVIVHRLLAAIALHLKTAGAAEIIRDGFRVAIAGAPNAGKSTLLNTLARRDVAIVTDIAGTTRDVLDVSLDLGGIKVVVSDTAGLRETTDRIELIGIERAKTAINDANLVLWLTEDVSQPGIAIGKIWIVRTKIDLPAGRYADFDFAVSCHSGAGVDALIDAIGLLARGALGNWSEGEIVSRSRHRFLLEDACRVLAGYENSVSLNVEFAAEDLRVAADLLGRITGVINTEDILGAIFSSFCIGK